MEVFLIEKIEEIAFAKVKLDESLWSSGVLDSITIVELAVEIEAEYKIDIPFEQIKEENFETVNLLINFINKKVAATNA
ncbi:MAG: acyl carrier protein [Flavobacteriales bacterium]|nr:acyl carrier protein [Flavobacteriales bacterium]